MQDTSLEHSSCNSLWWVDTSQQLRTYPATHSLPLVPGQSLTNETCKNNLQAPQCGMLYGIEHSSGVQTSCPSCFHSQPLAHSQVWVMLIKKKALLLSCCLHSVSGNMLCYQYSFSPKLKTQHPCGVLLKSLPPICMYTRETRYNFML